LAVDVSRAVDEPLKLTAGAIDRLSSALVTLGVVAPAAGRLYVIVGAAAVPTWFLLVSFAARLTAALVLHGAARWMLKGLDES
jgi:hypothetical protein